MVVCPEEANETAIDLIKLVEPANPWAIIIKSPCAFSGLLITIGVPFWAF